MLESMIFKLIGSLVSFGLKWWGTKMINDLIDRISLRWYQEQQPHIKNKILKEVEELDLQARALVVIRKRKFEWEQRIDKE